MKRIGIILIILVIVLSHLSFLVFADITDPYPGGGMTMYQTPLCILTGSDAVYPAFQNGSNPFSGAYCLNQYTDGTPTSGTYVTISIYNNNNTQKYYRFMAAPGGNINYPSVGYAPVNAPELSINRRRILPSYVNMITTIGNTMADFNLHPATCHGTLNEYDATEYGNSRKIIALACESTYYPCPWTAIHYASANMGQWIVWEDGSDAAAQASRGTCLYIFLAAGYKINYCMCGKQIFWPY